MPSQINPKKSLRLFRTLNKNFLLFRPAIRVVRIACGLSTRISSVYMHVNTLAGECSITCQIEIRSGFKWSDHWKWSISIRITWSIHQWNGSTGTALVLSVLLCVIIDGCVIAICDSQIEAAKSRLLDCSTSLFRFKVIFESDELSSRDDLRWSIWLKTTPNESPNADHWKCLVVLIRSRWFVFMAEVWDFRWTSSNSFTNF